MIPCPHCGNPIRETARFCNNCGKAVTVAISQPLDSGNGGNDANGGRVAKTNVLAPASARTPQAIPATQPIPTEEAAPNAAAAPPEATPPENPIHPLLVLDDASLSDPLRQDDRLPWPLPASIIMDGRYRVEALLQSSDESNTYRVTDLRGYEKCWACGHVYGAGAATERYCRDCGADMLARELLLHERRQAPGEEVPEDPATEPPRQFVQSGRVYLIEPKATQGSAYPRGARLVAGAATDAGHGRYGDHNEDSAVTLILDRFFEDAAQPLGLFIMADGMGGHASGHRASRMVANVMTYSVLRQLAMPLLGAPGDVPLDEDTLATVLREAVKSANNSLCAANQEANLDAGSTLVAALIAGETAHIANVGDSRCYVYDSETGLRRITTDHSLVQQLVASGMIQPEDVYTHPERNKIFRSLGDDPEMPVDLFVQQLKPGMRLLLCCDGLWEMVRDPQIEQILCEAPDPQAAADALIVAANDGGGDDNITVVVAEAR